MEKRRYPRSLDVLAGIKYTFLSLHTRYQRNSNGYSMLSGSRNTMAAMQTLCDVRGSGKSKMATIHRKLIWKSYIAAHRQDINEIPTATPRFSGSTNTMGICAYCTMYGERNIKDGGHKPEVEVEKRYILASRQGRNGIQTATPRFSESRKTIGHI